MRDGHLYFVDRKKNVIRRSGENISAVEVESVLAQHPACRAGRSPRTPDAMRGDEVLACIVVATRSRPRTAARSRGNRARALERLAYYKAPG